MKNIKEQLKYVDLTELKTKISAFHSLDFSQLTYEQIQSEVKNIVTFTTPEGEFCFIQPTYAHYPKGTRFYRVRVLPEDDRETPLRTLNHINDCWEPNTDIARANRLNSSHESVLYTAPQSPLVAITEKNIQLNEMFGLLVYEALDTINVAMIGAKFDTSDLSQEDTEKLQLIEQFVTHIFTRPIKQDEDYLFQISQCLVNDYYNVPNSVHHAWCYPSATQAGSFNACFPKKNRQKLKFVGLQVASVIQGKSRDHIALEVKIIAIRTPYGVTLDYHQVGTEIQRSVFPEISPSS